MKNRGKRGGSPAGGGTRYVSNSAGGSLTVSFGAEKNNQKDLHPAPGKRNQEHEGKKEKIEKRGDKGNHQKTRREKLSSVFTSKEREDLCRTTKRKSNRGGYGLRPQGGRAASNPRTKEAKKPSWGEEPDVGGEAPAEWGGGGPTKRTTVVSLSFID